MLIRMLFSCRSGNPAYSTCIMNTSVNLLPITDLSKSCMRIKFYIVSNLKVSSSVHSFLFIQPISNQMAFSLHLYSIEELYPALLQCMLHTQHLVGVSRCRLLKLQTSGSERCVLR